MLVPLILASLPALAQAPSGPFQQVEPWKSVERETGTCEVLLERHHMNEGEGFAYLLRMSTPDDTGVSRLEAVEITTTTSGVPANTPLYTRVGIACPSARASAAPHRAPPPQPSP